VRPLAGASLALVWRVVETWRDQSIWALINETHKPGGAWDKVYNPDGVEGAGYGRVIPDSVIAACWA